MTKQPTAGQAFKAAVLAEFVGLRPDEELILDELADAVDERRAAKDDASRRGWTVIISRLVAQLALPDPDTGEAMPDGKRVRGRAAAAARWDRDRVRNEAAS